MRNSRAYSDQNVYRLLSVVPTLVAIRDDNQWTDDMIETWSVRIARLTWNDEHSNTPRFWSACKQVIGPFSHP